jgi:arylsulfatase
MNIGGQAFEFTGELMRVTMHEDQKLDGEGVGHAQLARQ